MPSSTLQGRPGHRRSYTTTTFSTENGPGAFVPLGGLPRRRPQKKFVLNDDEDDSPDDSHDPNDDDSLSNIPPKLLLKKDNSFRLSITTATDDDAPPLRTKQSSPTGVPFPRSSPLSTSAPASASPTEPSPLPSRSNVTRTTSTPIFLSNGKPLKSSLKSSSSSPHIPFPPQQPSNHLRARSAPSTPNLEHPIAKNVHFPTNEEGGLATVRIFNRSAKPASLSTPNGEDTETETEGELSTGSNSGFIRGQSAVFPFPRSPLSHHHHHEKSSMRYGINTKESSAIPLRDPSPYRNVYLESLSYTPHSRSADPQGLSGTLLVRNIAFEKQVVVRFTLDDWQTTSEVSSRHLTSLSSLPTTFLSSQPLTYSDVAALHSSSSPSSSSPSSSTSEGKAPEWDRFGFTIKLEDYAANLSKRTMFLVARYIAVGGGGPVESWDNNLGRNYKIAFREVAAQASQRGRTFAVSSPPSFSPSTMMTASKPATATTSSPSSPSSFPLPAYSPPLSSSSPPSSTTQPQHAQMLAQTTILRLKRLNLRNYAAPSNSISLITPIPPSSSSGTTPASTGGGGSSEVMPDAKEATGGQGTARGNLSIGMEILGGFPAHVVGVPPLTRREESESSEDEDEVKTPDVFEARPRSRTPSPPNAGVGREEFQFPPKAPSSSSTTATIPNLTFSSSSSSPSPSSSSSSVPTPTLSSNQLMPMDIHRPAMLSPLEMGTSPPFSMMAEIGPAFAKRRDAQHHHHSLSHPPTSFPSPTASRSSTTASSTDSQLNPSEGGDGVHWLWGHSILDTTIVPQTEEEVKKVLAGIREKSTSSPVRRVSPSSSGRTSPVKVSASALSSSTKLPMDGGAVVERASSPVKKLEEVEEEEVELVSPQPTKKSPDWSKVGSGWNKGVGNGMNGANHPRASPISFNAPTSSSSPLSDSPTPAAAAATAISTSTSSPNATPTPSSTTNDSVYQAFVRQWCFAQGPSPVLGTGNGTTTSHASLSSTTQGSRYAHGRGRERRGAEGAEGGELVV